MTPALRGVQALVGVLRRNYDYERFWVVFPLLDESGASLFGGGVSSVELVVRVYDKEGRVTCPCRRRSGRGASSWRRFVVSLLKRRAVTARHACSLQPEAWSLPNQLGFLNGSAGWSSNSAVGISNSMRGV